MEYYSKCIFLAALVVMGPHSSTGRQTQLSVKCDDKVTGLYINNIKMNVTQMLPYRSELDRADNIIVNDTIKSILLECLNVEGSAYALLSTSNGIATGPSWRCQPGSCESIQNGSWTIATPVGDHNANLRHFNNYGLNATEIWQTMEQRPFLQTICCSNIWLNNCTTAGGSCTDSSENCDGILNRGYSCGTGIDCCLPKVTGCKPSFDVCDPNDRNQFQCNDTCCIYQSWKCDGTKDCPDGSDEFNCLNDCTAVDGGKCTDFGGCDGILHLDYLCETETFCCLPRVAGCRNDFPSCDQKDGNQFQCDDYCCIYKSWQCDGSKDCPDGSDEWDCIPRSPCLDSLSYDTCLYNKLFANPNNTYNRLVLPRDVNSFDAIDVTVNFTTRSLGDIDDVNQVMSVTGYITLTWIDPRLKWFFTEFPTYDLIVPADTVWLPDVATTNSIDAFYDKRFRQEFRVRIKNDGRVTWDFGGLFCVSCDLNIGRYPFDSQQCFIQVETWQYSCSDVNLTVNANAGMGLSEYENNSLWDLVDTSFKESIRCVSTEKTKHPTRNPIYPQVHIIFTWKRKSGYYIINYVVPAVLLTFITFAVFWVPAGGGERIGLGITVLLSFTVYQIIITGIIPVSSDNYPVLGQLILAMIVVATLAQLTSIFICTIDQETSHPVPVWVKKIFLGRLATILCVRDESDEKSSGDSEKLVLHSNTYHVEKSNDDLGSRDDKTEPSQQTPKYNQEWNAVIDNVQAIRAILDKKEEESRICQEWQRLARVIDRLLFTAAAIGFGVYIIILVTSLTEE